MGPDPSSAIRSSANRRVWLSPGIPLHIGESPTERGKGLCHYSSRPAEPSSATPRESILCIIVLLPSMQSIDNAVSNPRLTQRCRQGVAPSPFYHFLFILGYISLVRTPLMFKSREHNASTDTLKSPNPHVSSTFKKSKKNPSTLGMLLDLLTQRTIIRVICSSWFTPRVQSKLTKKYLASLMRSTTLLLTNIFI
jgi:hypothetical protein